MTTKKITYLKNRLKALDEEIEPLKQKLLDRDLEKSPEWVKEQFARLEDADLDQKRNFLEFLREAEKVHKQIESFNQKPFVHTKEAWSQAKALKGLTAHLKEDPSLPLCETIKQELTEKAKEWDKHFNTEKASRLKLAEDVAKQLNQAEESWAKIKPHIREPLENLEPAKGLQKPEEKFARLISYENFVSSLRHSFQDTLSNILRSPPDQQEYIIIADDAVNKSTNWVVSHTLDMMSLHRPKAIVNKGNVVSYLREHPEVKHVVMMDDGAYSGEQATKNIQYLDASAIADRKFHLCIPYMTHNAKAQIEKAFGPSQQYRFADYQIMLSYQKLYDWGFFGYARFNRPDVESLLSLKPLAISTDMDEGEKKAIKKINARIKVLKATVFKLSDERLQNLLDQLITSFQDGLDQKSQPFQKEMNSLISSLQSIRQGVLRPGFDKELGEQAKSDYSARLKVDPGLDDKVGYVRDPFSRTGVAMGHKFPDALSTDQTAMLAVTSRKVAIEPYKNEHDKEERRAKQVRILKETHPELEDNWKEVRKDLRYTGITSLVKSNRGHFLLANNYIRSRDTNELTLTLTLEGKEFLFGGKDGMHQLKLEEGMVFELNDGQTTKKFKFSDGCLHVEK